MFINFKITNVEIGDNLLHCISSNSENVALPKNTRFIVTSRVQLKHIIVLLLNLCVNEVIHVRVVQINQKIIQIALDYSNKTKNLD